MINFADFHVATSDYGLPGETKRPQNSRPMSCRADQKLAYIYDCFYGWLTRLPLPIERYLSRLKLETRVTRRGLHVIDILRERESAMSSSFMLSVHRNGVPSFHQSYREADFKQCPATCGLSCVRHNILRRQSPLKRGTCPRRCRVSAEFLRFIPGAVISGIEKANEIRKTLVEGEFVAGSPWFGGKSNPWHSWRCAGLFSSSEIVNIE